jgi:hypothetical protein
LAWFFLEHGMSTTAHTATQTEFARQLGVRKSYVTKLKQTGRLVLTEDGKRVVVEASKQRIAETKDPNRADVVERHAAAREQLPSNGNGAGEPAAGDDTPVPGQRLTHAEAKAQKEFYLAENARLDYEERCGKLLPRDRVRQVVADAFATTRITLESLPALLAPTIANRDEQRVQALLAEHIELALAELSHRLGRLGDRV